MDYFENLVKTLLEEDFHWVSQSVKVEVTKEEKRQIGKPSIPRPEIDLLVYDYKNNQVIAFEAKSYLDSPGVDYKSLCETHDVPSGRYKLFTCDNYRDIVFSRLRSQLLSGEYINSSTTLKLGLVAGNVYKNEDDMIFALFESKGWVFWNPAMVKSKIEALAKKGYENNPYIITAKMLLR